MTRTLDSAVRDGKLISNKVVYYDPIADRIFPKRQHEEDLRFDSIWEYKCFKVLREFYPLEAIGIHEPVTVQPEYGRHPEIKWKVDFTIYTPLDRDDSIPLYVEAKGLWSIGFYEKLKLFKKFYPDKFDWLIIIGESQPTWTKGTKKVLTLDNLRSLLRSLRKHSNQLKGLSQI